MPAKPSEVLASRSPQAPIHEAKVGEAVSYGLAAAGALIATLLFVKLPGKRDPARATLIPILGGAKLVHEF